jgi:hypothetical protein
MSDSPRRQGRGRWEGDVRGRGVADARNAAAAAEQLVAEMRASGWVTEDPIAHLRPKLDAWLKGDAGDRFRLQNLSLDGSVLVIDVEWLRSNGRLRDLRADAYALIGSFVEDSSYICQRVTDAGVTYEIATGQPGGEFDPHGHLVRVRVVRPEGRA